MKLESSELIAERLKELKKLTGFTNLEIAEGIGVTQPSVSRWLSGKNPPQREHLEALAQFFEVPYSFIAGFHVAGHPSPVELKAAIEAVNTAKNNLDRALEALYGLKEFSHPEPTLKHKNFGALANERRRRKAGGMGDMNHDDNGGPPSQEKV